MSLNIGEFKANPSGSLALRNCHIYGNSTVAATLIQCTVCQCGPKVCRVAHCILNGPAGPLAPFREAPWSPGETKGPSDIFGHLPNGQIYSPNGRIYLPMVPRRGQGCRRFIWPSARWPNPAARAIAKWGVHVQTEPMSGKGETWAASPRFARAVPGMPQTCGGAGRGLPNPFQPKASWRPPARLLTRDCYPTHDC